MGLTLTAQRYIFLFNIFLQNHKNVSAFAVGVNFPIITEVKQTWYIRNTIELDSIYT